MGAFMPKYVNSHRFDLRDVCRLKAIPHCVTVDDHYRGYDIPAGCMIIPNVWSASLGSYISGTYLTHSILAGP